MAERDDLETMQEGDAAAARPLSLLVVGEHTVASHRLPGRGTVVLGRAPGVDVQIAAPWISRRHAAIHVGPGIALTVEDLGSANGTRLRDARLAAGAPQPLQPGDVVELGSTLVVVQRDRTDGPTQRVRTDSYFEARLADECARGRKYGLRFAVLAVAEDGAANEATVAATLAAATRAVDVTAKVGDDFRVLLVNATRSEADGIVARVARQLAARAISVRVGLACFPEDGGEPGELLAALRTTARAIAPSVEPAAALVAVDPRAREALDVVERSARAGVNVLLVGEPGTGKGLFAERYHAASGRGTRPLVRLACSALTPQQVEAELFGVEGAGGRPGLIEAASGGTLQIDGLGDLPAELQGRLRHALVDGQTFRVNGTAPRSVDVRCVATSRRPLDEDVARGVLARDLYDVLARAVVHVAPLRERPTDVAPLARAFAAALAERLGRDRAPGFTADAIAALEEHELPGNARELRAIVERAALAARGDVIEAADLGLERDPQRGPTWMPPPPSTGAGRPLLKDEIDVIERQRILATLERCGGNQSKAARELGISRNTLIARLKAYGVLKGRDEP